jgi:tripartite-type tricarboxylate transporter receptor subunit TctC
MNELTHVAALRPAAEISRRRLLHGALLAAPSALIPGFAFAQADVLEQVRLITGSPPGSVLDLFSRRVSEGLKPAYARTSFVENKTGASGQIAVSAVKASAPDGATVLVTPMPQMGIFPHTYKKLPYDPQLDFIPVSMGAVFDLAFAVGPAVPASVKTMNQFLEWCKSDPKSAAFGSPASGSTPHFVGVMAARSAKVDLTHVPYRGPTPAIADMVGGQVAAACSTVGDFLSYAEAGRCRIIATTGAQRSRFAPNVPTLLEQGFSDIVVNDWFGLFVPAKTPQALVQRLNATLKVVLADATVTKSLQDNGLQAMWSTPDELAARLKADLARWGPVVAALKFSADS